MIILRQSDHLGMAYDENLGIDSEIINYILDSHQKQIRISSTRCYLLQQNSSGSAVGNYLYPMILDEFRLDGSNYKGQIWPLQNESPNIRLDINGGFGNLKVLSDNVELTRVVEVADILSDGEFAVVKNLTLSPQTVDIVFNVGFNPNSHTITYYFESADKNLSPLRMKSGETDAHAFYAWSQYLTYKRDRYVDYHQILVRLPLTLDNLTINEEGLVRMREHQAWTLSYPYIREYDVLVIPATTYGREMRFEVIDKQDSIIQEVLVSQRFKLNLINETDKRYTIPLLT